MKTLVLLLCILALAAFWWVSRGGQTDHSDGPTSSPPAASIEPAHAPKSPSSTEPALPAPSSISTSIPDAALGHFPFPEVLAWVANLPPTSGDAPIPADLLPILRLRADTLRQLILTDPEAAIQAAITPQEYVRLPPAARVFFERPLAGTGSFGVIAVCNHDDASHGGGIACEVIHRVDLSGQPFTATIYGSRAFRQTENSSSLYGIAMGDTLALHEDDAVVFPASRVSTDPSLASQFAVLHHGQPSFFPDETAASQHAATLNR